MSEGARSWLSERESEPLLAWMIVLSALLHAAAGVALWLLPRELFTRKPPSIVAYTVKIVDPSALGGRLPKGELRPESAPAALQNPAPREEPKPEPPKPQAEKPPEPQPEEKTVTLPDVKPKPEPNKKVEKAVVPAPKPKPAPEKKPSKEELAKMQRDREIQEAVKRMALADKGKGSHAAGLGGVEEGKGAALGVGGDGGGGGVLTGLDFIIYKNQVEALIKKNWTWVGANPDLTIRVAFRIGDDGSIADLRVLDKSGDGSFDESVVRAIRISSPLPPPPDKYRQVFANYVLEFVSGELKKGG